MTQLEQILIIVKREITTQEMLLNNNTLDQNKFNYWSGGLASLTYIKSIIERMKENKK